MPASTSTASTSRTEDQPVGARAHLWTCTHPVVGEQQFLLVNGALCAHAGRNQGAAFRLLSREGRRRADPPAAVRDQRVGQAWDLRTPVRSSTSRADCASMPCRPTRRAPTSWPGRATAAFPSAGSSSARSAGDGREGLPHPVVRLAAETSRSVGRVGGGSAHGDAAVDGQDLAVDVAGLVRQ